MPQTDSSSLDSRGRASPTWLLIAAGSLAMALALHGPVAQWPSYHDFADVRLWLGVPNAANVLSNLPFALIGIWGLWVLSMRGGVSAAVHAGGSRRAWWCFSAALVCTAFGSALYHWAPGNGALVLDRLPIAWACAALLCAFLCERVDGRWADAPALAIGLVVATASVGWWWFTEQHGQSDLRVYLYVQFLPMLLVPLGLWLKLPPTGTQVVSNGAWWWVLALYGAAKLMELADAAVLDALAITSGHTLKHLLAAVAAWVVLRAAQPADQLR